MNIAFNSIQPNYKKQQASFSGNAFSRELGHEASKLIAKGRDLDPKNPGQIEDANLLIKEGEDIKAYGSFVARELKAYTKQTIRKILRTMNEVLGDRINREIGQTPETIAARKRALAELDEKLGPTITMWTPGSSTIR